ncbi:MAG: hypothetical protein HN730_07190, partial [Bdellovibrionales bacterium]|nr:hypothetical protein [Bdellovibrionales bacterium]
SSSSRVQEESVGIGLDLANREEQCHSAANLLSRGVLLGSLDNLSREVFVQLVQFTALQDILTSYLNQSMRFRGKLHPSLAVDKICQDRCSSEQRERLLLFANQHSKLLERKVSNKEFKTYANSAEVADQINSKVEQLNSGLLETQKAIDGARVGVNGKVELEQMPAAAKSLFAGHLRQYRQLQTSDLGALLVTDAIKNKIGSVRSLKEHLLYGRAGRYRTKTRAQRRHRITPYRKLKDRTIRGKTIKNSRGAAVTRAVNESLERLADLGQKVLPSNQGHPSLQQLLRVAPVAVGRVLSIAGSQSEAVCQELIAIEQQNKDRGEVEQRVESAILIADLTSLGLILAAPFTGGVSLLGLGVSQGAKYTVKKMVKVGVGMGMGSMGVDSIYSINQTMNYGKLHNELLAGYISQLRTIEEMDEADRLLERFKDYRTRGVLSSIGVINFGALAKLLKSGELSRMFKSSKGGGKLGSDPLGPQRRVNETLEQLAQDPALAKQLKLSMDAVGPERFNTFIGYLSQMDKGIRQKVFNRLRLLGPNSKVANNFISETSKVVGKSCRRR